MENRYSTLKVLAEAVKDLPNPTAYLCTPREMILRCNYDWATIYGHLTELAEESLVKVTTSDTVSFSITQEGIARSKDDIKSLIL